jgi:hypothetical protein
MRRRNELADNLPTPELLRGSLLQRTIRHKSGCPKAAGEVVPQTLPSALTCFLRGLLTLRADQKPMVEQFPQEPKPHSAELPVVFRRFAATARGPAQHADERP